MGAAGLQPLIPGMPAWTIAAGAIFIFTDTGFTGMADRLQFAITEATIQGMTHPSRTLFPSRAGASYKGEIS